jgi:hypothetical protein
VSESAVLAFEQASVDLERTLADVDPAGAIQETAAAALPSTRGSFLTTAIAAAAGASALGGALARPAVAQAGRSENDTGILRFDLVLEYLQAGMYTEAERLGELKPTTLAWARVVGAHERAHVQAIKNLLGRDAVPSPTFDYGKVTSDENAFIRTAVAFEDLTAALLKWQAPRLDSRSILAAVVTLHSVETRHAAWIRHIVGIRPATTAFDQPASQHRMAQLIDSTHFISSKPKVTARSQPKYTG